MRNKKGISLITLVLIIVAILVISTIVLVVLINNNKKQQSNNQSNTKLSELSTEEKENYSSEIQLILDYANQSQYVDINEESAQQLVAFSHKNGIGAITDIDCFGTVEYNENGKTIYAWTIILYGEQDSFRADVSENDGVIYSITYNDKVYYKKDIENIDVKNETNTEKENNDAENENATLQGEFWVDDYKNWGEQKESFTLTLFDGKFTTPIDLKSADGFVKKYTYTVNKKNVDPTTSIFPIMNSEDLIGISGTRIWAYYGELNEYNSYQNSLTINVENYKGTDTTLKECIANKWWYIEENIKSPERTLGIDMTNEPEYNKDGNAKPLLDRVVNELGAPKHIYVTERTSDGGLEIIKYLLSYEYDNFSVMIKVSESLYNNMHQTMVGSVIYYNNICRDKRLEELKSHYELNPNSSIKFEIMK